MKRDLQSNYFSNYAGVNVALIDSIIAGNYFGYYPNKTHMRYLGERQVRITGAVNLVIGTNNDGQFDALVSFIQFASFHK